MCRLRRSNHDDQHNNGEMTYVFPSKNTRYYQRYINQSDFFNILFQHVICQYELKRLFLKVSGWMIRLGNWLHLFWKIWASLFRSLTVSSIDWDLCSILFESSRTDWVVWVVLLTAISKREKPAVMSLPVSPGIYELVVPEVEFLYIFSWFCVEIFFSVVEAISGSIFLVITRLIPWVIFSPYDRRTVSKFCS